jgi:hypothetical protein
MNRMKKFLCVYPVLESEGRPKHAAIMWLRRYQDSQIEVADLLTTGKIFGESAIRNTPLSRNPPSDIGPYCPENKAL